ncbi:MAG: class I SAM-dependent methyltransferase [Candidatus Brocadia sp. AMX2]|uniref:class I SAM-dependent methyltransferase n=1 Tax=Candidatus Brocadia TaxID=380240 RepID=UPI0006967368|nr:MULTISPECIES: class I SAM-dependent methyltransferase [Brocadia]MBC6932800.1 class I SAM-dependent methyltransferase [Candidatus Brocadia sp.]MBL1169979.1 class I SAM-dependent methyltransferase [Candidatus Brocadia sp. AMX1]MCK6467489.1 class I SAM-dependent methyltransferase [Candidatus Brocadia sinica]NOG41659.1 class I SAM-dependent methyltransferase [Planctomycetota bacterium]KAA0244606.1 MAG: class I SAM-dependent methyltransferase [Candidatus Brocadia sp. AMX2]
MKKSIPSSPVFLYIITVFCILISSILPSLFANNQDKQFWDKKYETEAYIFGKEPVEFLKEHIDILPRGKALDIAMGEGRNAVFLAENGFAVDGCDISEIAVKKAKELAKEHNVAIHAFVADLETSKLPKDTYDVIACFYYLQRDLIPQMKEALKPGGMIIYETYTIENRERGFEGPKNKDYLLKPNELLDLFKDLKIIYYRELVLNNKKAIASLIAKK